MQRKTAQREILRDCFTEANRPLSPQEALDAAQRRLPRMGIATVYRTLKSLVEDGWLVPVDIPGEPPRYERAGKPHHHHFHCRECGTVYDVQGCPPNLRALTPRGFRLEGHEVVLYGLCRGCRA